MQQPLDTLGRPLRDLRISVTDRCNFRCVYCMPKEVFGHDYRFLPRRELLSFEEIERVSRVFVELGVHKLRITGGEPLLRRGLEDLVGRLAALGDLDVTLTTNGALLAQKAQALADAGLSRVTVSLDSLDDEVFRAMNDVDFPVARVLGGIDAAAAAGLPVKVNVVVKRGLNEDSVLDIARRFRGTGHVVRFIEFMDVGATNGWRMDDVVPAAEIVRTIGAEFPLEPVEARATAGRSPSATATSTGTARSASSHPSRSRSAATARARGSRRTESSTPASSPSAATISAQFYARARRTTSSMTRFAPSGNAAPTAIRSSERRRRARCARSRCPTSAADAPDSRQKHASRRFEMRAQVAALESNTRVFRRRRNPTAPATWLGASRLPVRHLDGLLRRVPGRARRGRPRRRHRVPER